MAEEQELVSGVVLAISQLVVIQPLTLKILYSTVILNIISTRYISQQRTIKWTMLYAADWYRYVLIIGIQK